MDCIEKHTPVNNVTVRPTDKAWLTKVLKRKITLKDREYRSARKTGHPTIHRVWRKYHELNNEISMEEKDAKRNYLDKLAESLISVNRNPRDWWRAASVVFGKTKTLDEISLSHGDLLITDNQRKADLFNEYFASITSIAGSADLYPNLEPESEPYLTHLHFEEHHV